VRARVALAAIVAAAAAVYARALPSGANYDEGVYLASLRELRHGATIGGSLFTSQPPGFYWLLRVLGLFGGSLHTLRILVLVIALAGCIAAFAVGRRIAGEVTAVACAAALAIAPPWPVQSTRLEADLPATALAVVALALAGRFPVAAGAVFALAVSVKLLAVAAVVPLALLVRSRGRAALGAGAAVVLVLLSVVTHLGGVWHDAVGFHLHARNVDAPSFGSNVHRVVTFTDLHTPFGLLAVLAVIVAVVRLATHRGLPGWQLWTFVPAAAVVLAAQHPLLDHQLVLLAAAWALPVGATLGATAAELRRPLLAAAAAVAALAVAGGLVQQRRQLAPVAPDPGEAAAVAAVQRLTPRAGVVASDVPIVPYRAGRRQPPDLVDTSAVRVESGDLSDAEVLRDVRGASAVVLGRTLAADAALVARIERRYPRRVRAGSFSVLLPAR
jgi:4-amino-4-deoxy-L-arabinose transferase-like glycosyltransferase